MEHIEIPHICMPIYTCICVFRSPFSCTCAGDGDHGNAHEASPQVGARPIRNYKDALGTGIPNEIELSTTLRTHMFVHIQPHIIMVSCW